MKVLTLLALVVAAASLGYALRVHVEGSRPVVPTERSEPNVVAIEDDTARTELARLEGRIAALRTQMELLRGQQMKTANAQPSQEQRPVQTGIPSRTPTAMREEEEARRAAIAEIDSAFRSEKLDPQWAAATSKAIQEGLGSSEELRSLDAKVDCRTHTCRVDVVEDAPGRVSQHLRPFLTRLGTVLPSSTVDYVEEGNGRTRIVMYLDQNAEPPSTSR